MIFSCERICIPKDKVAEGSHVLPVRRKKVFSHKKAQKAQTEMSTAGDSGSTHSFFCAFCASCAFLWLTPI
jgi:hypothetical protein